MLERERSSVFGADAGWNPSLSAISRSRHLGLELGLVHERRTPVLVVAKGRCRRWSDLGDIRSVFGAYAWGRHCCRRLCEGVFWASNWGEGTRGEPLPWWLYNVGAVGGVLRQNGCQVDGA